MDKLKEVLKKYDKQLRARKKLDGSVEVYRQSPFNTSREHRIRIIQKQFLGSAYWVRIMLIQMDSSRFDIVGKAKRHNWSLLKHKKQDNRMTSDLVNFYVAGGESFVN